jgi:hypothetical protein
MSNSAEQRLRDRVVEETGSGDDANESGLADVRAETDRLFAVAARSFEAMSQGSSQDFLRRSRQTGGQ